MREKGTTKQPRLTSCWISATCVNSIYPVIEVKGIWYIKKADYLIVKIGFEYVVTFIVCNQDYYIWYAVKATEDRILMTAKVIPIYTHGLAYFLSSNIFHNLFSYIPVRYNDFLRYCKKYLLSV